MRQRRAAGSSRSTSQSTASREPRSLDSTSATGPSPSVGPAAAVESETSTLDAVDAALGAMAADDIADTLARATRGEDVPPDDLTAAQLGLDALDDDGVARVLDRLRAQGLLEDVVDARVLEQDHMTDLESRTEVEVPLAMVVVEGISDGFVASQVDYATDLYGRYGIQVRVIDSMPMEAGQADQAMALEGDAGVFNVNDPLPGHDPRHPTGERADPGAEADRILAAAWGVNGDASVSHVAFVPRFPGADQGVNIDSDTYDTAHPGVVVAGNAHVTTLAHELGHHMDLEHPQVDDQLDENSPDTLLNVMAEQPGGRLRLEPHQVQAIRSSLRVRLVPRG